VIGELKDSLVRVQALDVQLSCGAHLKEVWMPHLRARCSKLQECGGSKAQRKDGTKPGRHSSSDDPACASEFSVANCKYATKDEHGPRQDLDCKPAPKDVREARNSADQGKGDAE